MKDNLFRKAAENGCCNKTKIIVYELIFKILRKVTKSPLKKHLNP